MRIKTSIEIKSFKDLFDTLKLKENTLYEVEIQCNSSNPAHQSFLFTGFKTGSYCYCYTNSGDPIKVESLYSLKIKKELCAIK